jgi:hypothetical protein
LARPSHRPGDEQAAAPPIVLPITPRGIALTDRVCWGVLGAAMAAAAALILYLNRGGTYYVDEVHFLYRTPGLEGLGDVLQPLNGHLVATTRLAFGVVLEVFGSGYLPFRLLAVATLLTCVALFYVLVKRQVGALAALAPAILLLLLGSDTQHVVIPVGFTILFSVAAGLGALLALDRGDRLGDVAACGLLTVSIATFGTGLAFAVGIAIALLMRGDRWRRAWIVVVPLAVYAAWWLWALDVPSSGDEQVKFSNLALIPAYVLESLAAVMAALTGLNYDFGELRPRVHVLDAGWGLAVVAIGALVLRLRRGDVPPLMWAALGIVLTYWVLGALVASELRPPGLTRYLFVGALGVLLVAAAAASSVRFSRLGVAVLFAVAGAGLATNLALMRDGAAAYRAHSAEQRAEFTAFELARGHVEVEYDSEVLRPELAPEGTRAATYFEIVDRYGGSPAFSVVELERQPEAVRQAADRALAGVLEVAVAPAEPRAPRDCREHRSETAGGSIEIELPAGGADLSADAAEPATLAMGRFADASTVELGTLAPGDTAELAVPADGAPTPWRVSVGEARAVTLCPPA